MDFTLSDEQSAVEEAARGIFDGIVTPERVQKVEESADRFDRDLWSELAGAELLGLAVPGAYGGGGLGMVEVALVLEAQGRVVAPVPLWATTVLGAMPIAEFGSESLRAALLPGVVSGSTVLTAALTDVAGDVAVGGEGRPTVRAEPLGAGGVTLTGVAVGGSFRTRRGSRPRSRRPR